MRLTYDDLADAAYVYVVDVVEPGESKRRVSVSLYGSPYRALADVVIDLDKDGRILGFEILGARRHLRPETRDAATTKRVSSWWLRLLRWVSR